MLKEWPLARAVAKKGSHVGWHIECLGLGFGQVVRVIMVAIMVGFV